MTIFQIIRTPHVGPLSQAAFVLCLFFGAAACRRTPVGKPALRYDSQQTLHEDTSGILMVTTHYTKGVVGLPVWQVWFRAAGASEVTPLFTVERVWQEKEPAPPVFDDASGEFLIRDEPRSYIYSFRQRIFIHNACPSSVYVGPYKK